MTNTNKTICLSLAALAIAASAMSIRGILFIIWFYRYSKPHHNFDLEPFNILLALICIFSAIIFWASVLFTAINRVHLKYLPLCIVAAIIISTFVSMLLTQYIAYG
jgi:hypothetical protein